MFTGTERFGDGVRALYGAAAHHQHVAGVGIVVAESDESLVFVYADPLGTAAYQARIAEIPEVFRPSTTGFRHVSADDLDASQAGLVPSRLRHTGFTSSIGEEHSAREAFVLDVPGCEPSVCLIVGVRGKTLLDEPQLAELSALAMRAAELFNRSESAEREVALLRRLEAVANVLPALFLVLDVREIFDRLSALTRSVLPHDFGSLGLLSDDLTEIDVHAETLPGSSFRWVGPVPYPPVQQASWMFRFVEDLLTNPFERDAEPARAGGRSSLRLAVRFGELVVAVLSFTRRQVSPFTADDLVVARRIADYVALALAHQRLSEEARRNEELRERTTNLELLDALLVALVDSGDSPQVFARIAEISRKVLPHDAAALMVRLPDGRRARVYTSGGVPNEVPHVMAVPDELLANPAWEYDIYDDLSTRPPYYAPYVEAGWRSLLRVPIRFDGQIHRRAGVSLEGDRRLQAPGRPGGASPGRSIGVDPGTRA